MVFLTTWITNCLGKETISLLRLCVGPGSVKHSFKPGNGLLLDGHTECPGFSPASVTSINFEFQV